MSDLINPDHYKWQTDDHGNVVECIDLIRSQLTDSEFLGFCKGNVTKYMYRSSLKPGAKPEDDAEKALWYQSWIYGIDPRTGEKW